MVRTSNLKIKSITPIIAPADLRQVFPQSEEGAEFVNASRTHIKNILRGKDPRLMVVVGPCSIHDPASTLDYAGRLAKLANELSNQLFIVMRVYFEKPRTTIGWKGLINDPHLDGSQDIGTGLQIARKLLLEITEMGMPAATEFLDPIVPQYIADLVTWAAIGARTTESQTHREMASGLSMPVGLKNSTDGSLQVAIDAMNATSHPHSFLGINEEGLTSIVRTNGNPHAHVVLRGGRAMTNYDAASIKAAEEKLEREKLPRVLMVDCSHANSSKQFARQEDVWHSVIEQRVQGSKSLIGLMVESHLHEGNQPITQGSAQLKYGVSITDSCIGWETTERMLRWGHEALKGLGKMNVTTV